MIELKEEDMKNKVGDRIRTRWDDSRRPIPATITEKHRGHRGPTYIVRMEDGTTERVTADQVV